MSTSPILPPPLSTKRPDAFNLAIMKLTSFCDLNCTYCYMFNQADRTFERIPKQMSVSTSLRLLGRVEEHVKEHGKSEFHLTLHGGEPTLWPQRNFVIFLDAVEEIRARGLRLSVSIQTNAHRYDHQLLELLSQHRVTMGVSLDGPKTANDRFRVLHSGLGTYDRVIENVNRMLDHGYRSMLQGFLSVAQPTIDPEEYLDWADKLPIRRLDVLWPIQFHYGDPPWRHSKPGTYLDEAPLYGSWFADLFDAWWKRDDPTLFVRFFYDCLGVLLGSKQHVENIVNDTVPICVVNTDGQYEYHDYLRAYSDGACRTRMSVETASLTDLAHDQLFTFLINLGQHLPAACQACSVKQLCGGGFLPGRARPGHTLPDQKSVLCLDQYHFFSRLYRTLGRATHPQESCDEYAALVESFNETVSGGLGVSAR